MQFFPEFDNQFVLGSLSFCLKKLLASNTMNVGELSFSPLGLGVAAEGCNLLTLFADFNQIPRLFTEKIVIYIRFYHK